MNFTPHHCKIAIWSWFFQQVGPQGHIFFFKAEFFQGGIDGNHRTPYWEPHAFFFPESFRILRVISGFSSWIFGIGNWYLPSRNWRNTPQQLSINFNFCFILRHQLFIINKPPTKSTHAKFRKVLRLPAQKISEICTETGHPSLRGEGVWRQRK